MFCSYVTWYTNDGERWKLYHEQSLKMDIMRCKLPLLLANFAVIVVCNAVLFLTLIEYQFSIRNGRLIIQGIFGSTFVYYWKASGISRNFKYSYVLILCQKWLNIIINCYDNLLCAWVVYCFSVVQSDMWIIRFCAISSYFRNFWEILGNSSLSVYFCIFINSC